MRPSLVFMVLIVAILLVVIAIIIWAAVRMFRAKARSESMKESERIAQTQEFVREARRRGYKDNEVREMFVKKGWTDEEINSRAGL